MKNQEHIVFMFPKNDFRRIEEAINKLSKTELGDDLTFRYFVKRFKEQFYIDDKKTYSLEEAALITRKSPRTIYRYIKSGEPNAGKPHGEWRIYEDKLTEFAHEKWPELFYPHCG